MELNGIIGALVMSLGMGWLVVRNPSLSLALLAFSLPFDQQVIREIPFTVFSTEALIAGLVGGVLFRRIFSRSKIRVPEFRMWIPSLLVLAGWAAAFPGSLDHGDAVKTLIRWAELWVVLAITASLVRRGEADAKIISGGYLAGVVVAGIMVLREFIIAPMLLRPSGPISPNSIPAYMGLGLVLLVTGLRPRLGRHDRLMAWLAGILIMSALIASQSRTGVAAVLLGVLVSLALLGWPARRAILLSAGVIAILLGYAAARDWRVMYRLSTYPQFYKSPAFLERVEFYRLGEKVWEANPLLGVGPGSYNRALGGYFERNPDVLEKVRKVPLMYSAVMSHAHNLFLQVAIEAGIIGLGFWIGALVVLGFLLYGAPAAGFAGGMGLMVVFIFSNMLDITITHSRGVLFAVGWGIFLGARVIRKGKKKKGAG